MDLDTCNLLCKFDKVVYISCNPETLARDVDIMKSSHDVVRAAAFDQFPYTHHLESGVVLVRRPNSDSSESTAASSNEMKSSDESERSLLGKRKADDDN